MTSEIAKRMGVGEKFTENRTQEEWLRHLYEQSRQNLPELPTFEEFRTHGIFKNATQKVTMLLIANSVKILKITH